MVLFQQMLAFMAFMYIGYAMRKKGIVDEKGVGTISWLVANVANPALIISSIINREEMIPAKTLILVLVIAICVYAALVLLSFFIPVILRAPRNLVGEYRNITVFANIGFMGYPLLLAISGAQAVLYASLFSIVFSVLLYTFCIQSFAVSKGEQQAAQTFSLKRLFNVGIICCIIGVIMNFVPINLPTCVKAFVTNSANLTAALSMINIGMFLYTIEIKSLFTDVRLLVFSAIKMLLIPLVGLMIVRLFITDTLILTVVMIILAAPVASMVPILAQQCEGDFEFTTKAVALTTILAVFTMPLVSIIANLG